MSVLTPWGYTAENDYVYCELISLNDFNQLTAGKHNGDVRIEENIKAASMAIRNYCGWHIFPNLSCTFSERLLKSDGRVKRCGEDILVQLPATYVTGVSSVEIGGKKTEDFDLETGGLLRIFDACRIGLTRKTLIKVEYEAGIQEAAMASIRELVAHRVTHALVSSAGIASETAGGVSITYNTTWINNSRSTALPNDNKEVLEPYKLREVF